MSKIISFLLDPHTWTIISVLLTAASQIFPHADLSGLTAQVQSAAASGSPALMLGAVSTGAVALAGHFVKTPNGANGDK